MVSSHKNLCLYCKKSNGPFRSREHVIPESLGNRGLGGKDPIILPRGVVCDPCNNGPLSSLDQALINFDWIAYFRTVYTIPTKSGRLPTYTFGNNVTLRAVAPHNVVFDSTNRNAWVDEGPGRFTMNLRSRTPFNAAHRKKVTRAMFKMTLGCMYIDQPSVALSPRFDSIRRMILGDLDFHGYVTQVSRAWEPTAEDWHTGLTYGFIDKPSTGRTVWARFDFIKLSFFTDLEVRKPQKPQLYRGDSTQVFEF